MTAFDKNELRKLQLTLLEILLVVDKFCKENEIHYFLDSGTALGAVRHNGFIPWDDDADLGMLRVDFDRFIQLAQEGLPEGYSLHTFDNTPGYAGMFAKVYKDGTVFETLETRAANCSQCVFVDIFPYDELSSDRKTRARQLRSAGLWQRVSYLYHSPYIEVPFGGFVGSVARGACRASHCVIRLLFTRDVIWRKFEAIRFTTVEPSGKYALLAYPDIGPFDKGMMTDLVEREFEGHLFPCVSETERYLTIMYGSSWSELPPENKRRTHKPLRLVL